MKMGKDSNYTFRLLRWLCTEDFAEGSKILLATDLKIILLDHQNNFVGILKIAMLQKMLTF